MRIANYPEKIDLLLSLTKDFEGFGLSVASLS